MVAYISRQRLLTKVGYNYIVKLVNYTVYDELHPVEGMLLSHLMYRNQDFIEVEVYSKMCPTR